MNSSRTAGLSVSGSQTGLSLIEYRAQAFPCKHEYEFIFIKRLTDWHYPQAGLPMRRVAGLSVSRRGKDRTIH